jgi:recombinational DNA repair protein (RecF pathway)
MSHKQNRIVKEKAPNKYDKCVLCNTDTEYDEFDHIDSRYFYVEGAGQLCPKCWNETYEQKNDK